MNYGKIAYEEYCESSGGKSLISGAEFPKWEDLPRNIRDAWIAAGDWLAAGEAVGSQISEPLTQAERRGFESVQHHA